MCQMVNALCNKVECCELGDLAIAFFGFASGLCVLGIFLAILVAVARYAITGST